MEATANLHETINELISINRELLAAQRETNRLMRKELEPPSRWVKPDEAAVILGRNITKSGTHRRVLTIARNRGLLTVFGAMNPYLYDRKEVEGLADRMRSGEIFLN